LKVEEFGWSRADCSAAALTWRYGLGESKGLEKRFRPAAEKRAVNRKEFESRKRK
jgi:hypothetical protein